MRVSIWAITLSLALVAESKAGEPTGSKLEVVKGSASKKSTLAKPEPEKAKSSHSDRDKLIAYPAELYRCETHADCVAVRSGCGSWIAVNKNQELGFTQWLAKSNSKSCPSGDLPKQAPVVCLKNLCELDGAGSIAAASVGLWQDRCASGSADGLIEELPVTLRPSVRQLNSPLGWQRQQAVNDLENLGRRASKSLPWLVEALKRRGSVLSEREQSCLIGELPMEESVVKALGKIEPDPHPALQVYLDWLQDEAQVYRHHEILQQIQKMGPTAQPALGVLIQIIEKSNKQESLNDTSLLALDAIAAIGRGASSELPVLAKQIEKTKALKSRYFLTMMKIDSKNSVTKKAAYQLLDQQDDLSARTMALHYLAGFPEEMVDNLDLLKKILNSSEMTPYRLGALRAVQQLGKQAKSLVPEVVRLGLQGHEELRRQAALVLKTIDPTGKQSLALLKAKVYKGYPFEAQYIWKVIDSPLTRIELFKSYYYLVTGQRVKFKDLKISTASERALLACLESENCSQRPAAIAAMTLIDSQNTKWGTLLINALDAKDSNLRWEAAGGLILWCAGQGAPACADEPARLALSKAWELQAEALQQSGSGRLIDVEDILIGMGKLNDDELKTITKVFIEGKGVEALDGAIILVAKESETVRQMIKQSLFGHDKQKVVNLLKRVGLSRVPVAPWLREQITPLLNHSEPAIQEAAVIDHLSIGKN